jgi:hypothetical protein
MTSMLLVDSNGIDLSAALLEPVRRLLTQTAVAHAVSRRES